MDDLIVNQIKDACPCFCDKKDEEVKALIENLISLLSVSLCWNDTLCGSFLYGLREERFDYMPDCMTCVPCARYKKFPLFYHADGSELDIVSVTMHVYNGLEDTTYTLTEAEYTVRRGVLIIDNSNIPQNCCTCNCDEFELIVEYNAGYKMLPDCLLPLFCDLLVSMSLSLTGCGSINECCEMSKPKAFQILKSKKIGEITKTWEVDRTHTSYIYSQMLSNAKLARIAQLSCCNNDYNAERLWFVHSC